MLTIWLAVGLLVVFCLGLGGLVGYLAWKNARQASALSLLVVFVLSAGFVSYALVRHSAFERQRDSEIWSTGFAFCTRSAGGDAAAAAKCRCLFRADDLVAPRRLGEKIGSTPQC